MASPRGRVPLPIAGEVPLYAGDLEEDVKVVSRNQLAEKITGGLSSTTKMPCPSWGLSATRCRVGSVLAQQAGTVCHECYALRGRYAFSNVQAKLEERYRGLANPLWTPAMVFLIRYYCDRYFRWFDSGDLVEENHLRNICTVAANVPEVQMWLPTREYEVVRAVGDFPPNLVVRVSAYRIDGKPPRGFPNTSTVVSGEQAQDAFVCPAPQQRNTCGECRACWQNEVRNVCYRLH